MTRYAAKPDSNQAAIVKRLERVPGLYIQVVSRHGGLGWDVMGCLVEEVEGDDDMGFSALGRYQYGPIQLLEIKPEQDASPLTKSEKQARDRYGSNWHLVKTYEDALRAFGISTEPAPEEW